MARGRRGDNRRRSGVVSEMTKEEADLFVPAPPSLLSLNFSKPEPLLLLHQIVLSNPSGPWFGNFIYASIHNSLTEKKQFHCDDWNLQGSSSYKRLYFVVIAWKNCLEVPILMKRRGSLLASTTEVLVIKLFVDVTSLDISCLRN
ncbi:hypothetical protein YC2023_076448 [Brassica napus]